MQCWGDDAGSSTVFSFIVATSIFAIAFTSVTYFASDYISGHQAGGEELDAVAAAALAVLNGNPGEPSDWDVNTPPSRLGLLEVGATSTMDGTKIAALGSWQNAKINYATAVRSLGLEGYNVRIRSYPTFTLTSAGVTGLDAHEVAYIRPTSETITLDETTALDGTGVTFSAASADLDVGDGWTAGDVFPASHATLNKHFTPRLHGFLGIHDGSQVTPLQTYWKVVDLDTYGGPDTVMDDDATRVLTIAEKNGGTWSYGASRDLTHLTTTLDRVMLAEVDFTEAGAGDSVLLDIEHWVSGYTGAIGNDITDDYGIIEFYCTAGCVPTGWSTAGTRVDSVGTKDDFAFDQFDLTSVVGAGHKGYLALTWHSYDDGNAGEGWFVRDLTITTVADGATTVWDNDLDFEESLYDALVVGSEVDQSTLNFPADPLFDHTLKEWIEAGGDLVVTGSHLANEDWINELTSSVQTQGALILSLYEDRTDTTHAILNNPYNLRWTSYSTADTTYKPESPDPLNPVFADIVHHTQDGADEAFLSISAGGWASTYEGVALLTAYQPYAMGPVEAIHFYANSLVHAQFNDIQVDFGNQVPKGSDVGTAQRSVVIDAQNVDLGWLEGQMVVHVWR